MSFQDITVYRDFPVIAGYIQVPPNLEKNKTKVTDAVAQQTITGSVLTRLSQGSGKPTGRKTGQQYWLRLPGIVQGGCCPYPSPDPATTLIPPSS